MKTEMKLAWVRMDVEDNAIGEIQFCEPALYSPGWVQVLIQRLPETANGEDFLP